MASDSFFELFIIAILILINSFFSAAEIAVISLRKSKIKELIASGDKRANALMYLKSNPDAFFATIQAAMTVVTTLASAYAGATLIESLRAALEAIPLAIPAGVKDATAFLVIVASVSYLTIVLGELIPKSLAVYYSRPIALMTAQPLVFFERLFSPIVWILTTSTRTVTKIFGIKYEASSATISEEEIMQLIREGQEKGIIDEVEKQIIDNALTFTETTAGEIMTPNFKIKALDLGMTNEEMLKAIAVAGNSRMPVYEDDFSNVVGIVSIRDVLKSLVTEKNHIDVKKIMMKPLFVPESEVVSHLLQKMQTHHRQMVIVVNEYGEMEGLITIEDILEELVGEIRDEGDHDEIREVQQIEDNIFIVDGAKTIKDLQDDYNINLPEEDTYDTLAGFLFSQLQAVPKKGISVSFDNMLFTVTEIDKNRIAQVKIELGDVKKTRKSKKTTKKK